MPAPIAAAGAATATPITPVQTSAGSTSTVPAPASKADAPKADPNMGGKPGESKPDAAKAAEVKRFKTRIKDQGKEVEIDLEESDVGREIQKSRHYERTRGEFEKQRADFQKQIDQLKADPLAFLKQSGVDLRELAQQDAARAQELEKLTPEARRAAELEAEIQQLKGAEAKRLEAQQKEAEQAEHHQLVQGNLKTLGEAIKLSGRAKSGELLRLFAEVQELAITNGEPELSAQQIVAHAERLESKRFAAGLKRAATDPAWRARNAPLMKELAQTILPALEGQELVDFVGKENAVKLAKAQLALYRKNPLPQVAESSGEQPKEQPRPPPKFEEPQSMFGTLDKLAGR